jgi:hypothetical protein
MTEGHFRRFRMPQFSAEASATRTLRRESGNLGAGHRQQVTQNEAHAKRLPSTRKPPAGASGAWLEREGEQWVGARPAHPGALTPRRGVSRLDSKTSMKTVAWGIQSGLLPNRQAMRVGLRQDPRAKSAVHGGVPVTRANRPFKTPLMRSRAACERMCNAQPTAGMRLAPYSPRRPARRTAVGQGSEQ